MSDTTVQHLSLDGANGAAETRRLLKQACASWPGDRVEDAQLMATELVANALLHGRGRIRVRIAAGVERLRVEVADEAHARPVMSPTLPSAEEDHGRGLLIVDALADSWGTEPGPDHGGKTVWFELGRATE